MWRSGKLCSYLKLSYAGHFCMMKAVFMQMRPTNSVIHVESSFCRIYWCSFIHSRVGFLVMQNDLPVTLKFADIERPSLNIQLVVSGTPKYFLCFSIARELWRRRSSQAEPLMLYVIFCRDFREKMSKKLMTGPPKVRRVGPTGSCLLTCEIVRFCIWTRCSRSMLSIRHRCSC